MTLPLRSRSLYLDTDRTRQRQNEQYCTANELESLLESALSPYNLRTRSNLLRPTRLRLHDIGYWRNSPNFTSGTESLNATNSLPYTNDVDWSQYAYCQYVTNEAYLCNSLMIFEALVRLEAKAERLMLYPSDWAIDGSSSVGKLLLKARDAYGVRLMPIEIQHFDEYKRVLSLDSDSTVLQPMAELFLLPSAPVAMPRAYWLNDTLSSQLVLVEPSKFEFERILHAFATRKDNAFDMEIVNDLYGDACFIIPHRRYDLITGEFRADPDGHAKYLGSKEEQWDGDEVLKEAKLLHFSDWPVNKPWLPTSPEVIQEFKPKCTDADDGTTRCRDQELWLDFYNDFRERRLSVCGNPVG